MLNRLARYLPVVEFVSQTGAGSILEVGSGCLGIGEFLSHRFVGCDIDLPAALIPDLIPVRGSVTGLPFRQSSFQLVVCLDVLEHLAPWERLQAVEEMVRVSHSYLVVGAPSGDRAQAIDRLLFRWYRFIGKPVPPWLVEHMAWEFPDMSEVAAGLLTKGIDCRITGNENLGVHLVIMVLESFPQTQRILTWSSHRIRRFWRTFLPFLSEGGKTYRKIIFARKPGL